MEYADWINEVKKSREDNEESLRELTADWNLGEEFKRRRFIPIAEVSETPLDNESMMRLTGP